MEQQKRTLKQNLDLFMRTTKPSIRRTPAVHRKTLTRASLGKRVRQGRVLAAIERGLE